MTVTNDWIEKELEQLVVIDPENLREDTNRMFSFYYIDIGAVSEGKITLPSNKIAFREAPSRARKVVHRGDVLMSTVRPNLRAFAYFDHAEDDCIASTGFAVLRARVETDPRFILFAILSNSFTAQIEAHVVGSNYPSINSSTLSRLRIPSPPFPEQNKIADVLSTIDRAIEQTEALIAKQQRIKMGLMQDLFTRGIDEHGNLRSEHTHEFKDSHLGRIPVEWEASTLSNIASFYSGNAFKNHELTEHGWRVVRISNLHKPDFPYWHYAGRINPSWLIRSGDVLFSWAGVASSIDCIRYSGPDALMNQHIYNLKFASEQIRTYVHYFLQHYLPLLRTEIEGGAGQLHLTKAKIQSIPIPKLDENELNRTIELLDCAEESLDIQKNQLKKFRSLKNALMQDLLTGKRRVTFLLSKPEEAST